MKKKFSIGLKFLIAICSFLAVTLACIFAVRDGYSNWSKRLLYFTQLSNIWIGITCLVIGILLTLEKKTKNRLVKNYMYVIKYIFTISITLTGIIFCTLLGPFAGADYNAWSFSSLMTHMAVPVLSIIDFFVDDYPLILKRRHIFLTLIPPLAYFIFSTLLGVLNVDFGRGDTFPYFFLNLKSPAGLFGYVKGYPPQIGSFYWIIFILLFILTISYIYYKLHPNTRKYNKSKKQKKIIN